MPLQRYGFIIKAPGYRAEEHRADIDCETFKTCVRCVTDLKQAIDQARAMQRQGIELIELCGGFSEQEASSLIKALDSKIPVGHVEFKGAERDKLQQLLVKGRHAVSEPS